MKKLLLLIFISSLGISVHAQSLKGYTIGDREPSEKIEMVGVTVGGLKGALLPLFSEGKLSSIIFISGDTSINIAEQFLSVVQDKYKLRLEERKEKRKVANDYVILSYEADKAGIRYCVNITSSGDGTCSLGLTLQDIIVCNKIKAKEREKLINDF